MKYADLKDEQLIDCYIKGNELGLQELVRRHQSKIYNYLLMMLKDKELANDFFQDTFFKVIQTLKSGRYNEEGKFLPWVMRIAHNLVIDHYRFTSKMPTVSHVKSPKNGERIEVFNLIKISSESPDAILAKKDETAELKRLIKLLPDEQKEVLIMRHYLDMSFKEISNAAGININTALGRMRYALLNLRKMTAKSDIFKGRKVSEEIVNNS